MINKLLKKEIRTMIVLEGEENEYIEIKNPNEEVIKYVKENLLNKINNKEHIEENEMLEYLIKTLTNAELTIPLNELLSMELSMECKVMMYHITNIYHEIIQECMMTLKLLSMVEKTKTLEKEVSIELTTKL